MKVYDNQLYLSNRAQQKKQLAQFSPVYAISTGDFNNDGNQDMILAGNFSGNKIQFGEYDANKGLLLTGDGKGKFEAQNDIRSGFHIKGEVRDISDVTLASGRSIIVFALNNDSARLYGLIGSK